MMENVRIAILNAQGTVCAFMDNSAPEALHFYSDELHSYLEGSACTFSFTASARHGDSVHLAVGNKLAFRHRNRDYYFNIMKEFRTEQTVEVEAYALMFELLNEDIGAYQAERAMTFAEYLEAFDTEDVVELGLNEVSDKSVKNEWTGTDTILARIFSLANVFGAEAEFVPELNPDYSLKRMVLNVYRENDGECQGIGRKRSDITLRYGVNVKGIEKTSDIKELRTAIYPTGKDGLTVALLDKKELDGDGNVEFLSPAGDPYIYAVQARDRFPSNLLCKGSDRYIKSTWSYDTDNAEMLYGQALAELKKLCGLQVTYDIDGYFDTDIGDTVNVADEEYNPPLYLEARVTEQVRSFTDPGRNQTKFSSYKEMQPQIDKSLLDQMQKLIQESTAGLKGADAEVIRLQITQDISVGSVSGRKSKDASFIVRAKKKVGNDEETDYPGRILIESYTESASWAQTHVSTEDESIVGVGFTYLWPFTASSNTVSAVRVSLYQSGGMDVLLDQAFIPIVFDGADGTDGMDGTDGTMIWSSSAEPEVSGTTYTFEASALSGSANAPKAGDVILNGYYRYTVTAVSDTSVECEDTKEAMVDLSALEEEINNLRDGCRDSGWITLFSYGSAYIKYRMKNGIVTIAGSSFGQVSVPAASTYSFSSNTLPADYRPSIEIVDVGTSRSTTGYEIQVGVDTNGVITIYNTNPNKAATYWGFNITYPAQ